MVIRDLVVGGGMCSVLYCFGSVIGVVGVGVCITRREIGLAERRSL